MFSRKSIWKYLDNGTDQGEDWRQFDFDDSSWASGRARLGYGDGNEVTQVSFGRNDRQKHVTTYFRTDFQLQSMQGLRRLRLLLQRDDGAIVYLNGQEIVRDHMPSGTVRYNTPSITPAVGGRNETRFFSFDVPVTELRVGTQRLGGRSASGQ